MAALVANPLISQPATGMLPAPSPASSDATLLRAAKRGRSDAFGELCDRHAKQIYRAALRITRNHEDAEDAVQESFLRAFTHLSAFDERAQFSTWLTRITINSALMILRKGRRKRDLYMDAPDSEFANESFFQIPDAGPDPEETYLCREQKEIIRHAVGKLKPCVRSVVEVNHLDECSIQETAAKLRISTAATKARLLRARWTLRRMPILKAANRRFRWERPRRQPQRRSLAA
jgi:RNA polymerase sigma factor (sigma-70 family)